MSEHGHTNHGQGDQEHMVHEHRDLGGGTARATVFGISDGLVSNVALVLGVAAAGSTSSTVLLAGVSGLLAGAASMAAGEYVSVKAQTELVERELEIERASIAEEPELETTEQAAIYRSRGIEPEHAQAMATAVMADPDVALEVHAREELGVDPESIGNPLGAAGSSFAAFALGAALPLVPYVFASGMVAAVISVLIGVGAAFAVGAALAHFTERSMLRSGLRQVSLATAACVLTVGIGSLLGATVV